MSRETSKKKVPLEFERDLFDASDLYANNEPRDDRAYEERGNERAYYLQRQIPDAICVRKMLDTCNT